jgi:hypothetical protein
MVNISNNEHNQQQILANNKNRQWRTIAITNISNNEH